MSERGVDSHEGATVCPFVAFAEDRDRRGTDPDHRHRCYAELTPAPRAIAHQRRYCLSPEFPSCPTFQDWAVRAAATGTSLPSARAVAGNGASDDPPGAGTGSGPRRTRDWAAPPPWVAQAAAAKRSDQMKAFDDGDEDDPSQPFVAPFAPPPTPPPSPRAWPVGDQPRRAAPPPPDQRASWDDTPPQGELPTRPPEPVAKPASGRGFAYDLITDDPAFQAPGPDGDGPGAIGQPPPTATPWARADGTPRPGGVPRPSRRPPTSALPEPEYLPPKRRMATRLGHLTRDSRSDGSGEWEKPRRFEAYPSLRTRVGLPGLSALGRLPPVALGAIALIVAAVVLFMLPGLFAGGGAATDTPRPTRTVRPTVATAVPTTEAPATPPTYTVKRGDTLSKIAKDFGVTVAQLLAANPQVTNANSLKVGQVLTIPTGDVTPAPSVSAFPTAPP